MWLLETLRPLIDLVPDVKQCQQLFGYRVILFILKYVSYLVWGTFMCPDGHAVKLQVSFQMLPLFALSPPFPISFHPALSLQLKVLN